MDRMEQPRGPRGVWGEAIGSWSSFDTGSGIAGAHSNLGGLTLGVDDTFGAWRLGVAGTYSHDDIGVSERMSSAADQALGLSVYGASAWGPVQVKLGAGPMLWHSIDTSRSEVFLGPSPTIRPRATTPSPDGRVFGEVGV